MVPSLEVCVSGVDAELLLDVRDRVGPVLHDVFTDAAMYPLRVASFILARRMVATNPSPARVGTELVRRREAIGAALVYTVRVAVLCSVATGGAVATQPDEVLLDVIATLASRDHVMDAPRWSPTRGALTVRS